MIERITHERTVQQTFRSLVESRIVERLTVVSGRSIGAQAPTPLIVSAMQQTPVPATPGVEIHIGRIEVMSARAPVAEPRRIEAARPPSPQSLEAYLKERRKS